MNSAVTFREILCSVIIVLVMLSVGMFLSGKVQEAAERRGELFARAQQIESAEQFTWGLKTGVGNTLAYGSLRATESAEGFPEISLNAMGIRRVQEHYTMHTRTVTTTDEKGHTTTRTETYWTWDVTKRWASWADAFSFLGCTFPAGKVDVGYRYRLALNGDNITPGSGLTQRGNYLYIDGDDRYSYEFTPMEFTATLFGSLTEKDFVPVEGRGRYIDVFYERDIPAVLEDVLAAEKWWPISFWIGWGLLMAGAVAGFVLLENRWLES